MLNLLRLHCSLHTSEIIAYPRCRYFLLDTSLFAFERFWLSHCSVLCEMTHSAQIFVVSHDRPQGIGFSKRHIVLMLTLQRPQSHDSAHKSTSCLCLLNGRKRGAYVAPGAAGSGGFCSLYRGNTIPFCSPSHLTVPTTDQHASCFPPWACQDE